MSNAIARTPEPRNEPVLGYAPGSAERRSLAHRLRAMLAEKVDVPLVIGGKEVRTGNTAEIVCPHDHHHVLGTFHKAGPREVEQAVAAATAAWHDWSEMGWEARAAVFLKAAELLAGRWRDTLNAATMLNQSKTCFQAEIDSACELIDFWRFNPHYLRQLYEEQPGSAPGIWDRLEYRALEGFVFAVTPFNFTSIAGNLPTAPALMGNVVLWKPASTAVLSGWYILELLREAGLPDGVINFLPGSGGEVGDPILARPELAGVHFTGSTGVFQEMWKTIGQGIARYKSYPRIVGETGGKDFVFAHPSADSTELVTALVRGAFEYQGQKCSAASRAYLPRSRWSETAKELAAAVEAIPMGSPTDFGNFMAAVIDERSYEKTMAYLGAARGASDCQVLAGGSGDRSRGWFVRPTVVVAHDPAAPLMCDELFAPVLTVYVYEDAELDRAIELCDRTSPYALTGAVFARDRAAIEHIARGLRHAAGNFYINDKPTGAVVGQQPFGGGRASGTNDKAGSKSNLMRWVSQRAIKETFAPPRDWRYPHMAEESSS